MVKASAFTLAERLLNGRRPAQPEASSQAAGAAMAAIPIDD
jgi:hypothetical protein